MTTRPFLAAEWRYLAILTWRVPHDVLAGHVPAGVRLDLWRGDALASLVGFRFLRTRVLGVPVPGHRDFDEVNLRFYVRRDAPGGEPRRGVTFVREIVPRAAIAAVARLAYNEPYVALPMRSNAPAAPDLFPGRLHYAWRHAGRWGRLTAHAVGDAAPAAPGSVEEFVTERYWGYTPQRDGGTLEYRVDHPSWRLWRVPSTEVEGDLAPLVGAPLAAVVRDAPALACIADGSPVVVRRPTRVA